VSNTTAIASLFRVSQTLARRPAGASTSPVEEHAMFHRRRFLCRVLQWHHYQWKSTQDGSRYRACAYCGRENPDIYSRKDNPGINGAAFLSG
jgi:hypothetical protein